MHNQIEREAGIYLERNLKESALKIAEGKTTQTRYDLKALFLLALLGAAPAAGPRRRVAATLR